MKTHNVTPGEKLHQGTYRETKQKIKCTKCKIYAIIPNISSRSPAKVECIA